MPLPRPLPANVLQRAWTAPFWNFIVERNENKNSVFYFGRISFVRCVCVLSNKNQLCAITVGAIFKVCPSLFICRVDVPIPTRYTKAAATILHWCNLEVVNFQWSLYQPEFVLLALSRSIEDFTSWPSLDVHRLSLWAQEDRILLLQVVYSGVGWNDREKNSRRSTEILLLKKIENKKTCWLLNIIWHWRPLRGILWKQVLGWGWFLNVL